MGFSKTRSIRSPQNPEKTPSFPNIYALLLGSEHPKVVFKCLDVHLIWGPCGACRQHSHARLTCTCHKHALTLTRSHSSHSLRTHSFRRCCGKAEQEADRDSGPRTPRRPCALALVLPGLPTPGGSLKHDHTEPRQVLLLARWTEAQLPIPSWPRFPLQQPSLPLAQSAPTPSRAGTSQDQARVQPVPPVPFQADTHSV